MPIGYYKRLKMTGDWKLEMHMVTIKDLGYLGIRLRTKDQQPWDDHYALISLVPLGNNE